MSADVRINTTSYAVVMAAFDLDMPARGVLTASTGLAVTTGYVWAPYARVAHPGMFELSLTLNVLVVAVLGGVGSIYGILLGAWLVAFLPEVTAVADESAMVVFGFVLTVAALWLPRGLAGLLRTPVEAVARLLRPREGERS